MSNEFDLWTEKYRPKKLDDYVFKNNKIKQHIYEWIENPENKKIPIPNILLYGTQGIGKTSLARVICNELNVDKGDVMEINASRENNADTIREKIVNYCSTWPNGDYKVIILDECLYEEEEISLNNGNSLKLKDFEIGKMYEILNLNMDTGDLEPDLGEVLRIKENQEIYEVKISDDRTIKTTLDHPFLVYDDNKNIIQKELKDILIGDMIISSVGVDIKEFQVMDISFFGTGNVRVFTAHNNHTIMTKNGFITHNCDRLSPLAQDILRAEIEKYYDSVRFIGTANVGSKISKPLKSRFEEYQFDTLDMETFIGRIVHILDSESVTYDADILLNFIDCSYPDMRKCINLLSQHTLGKVLQPLAESSDTKEYMVEAVELFKNKKYSEGRKMIVQNTTNEDVEGVFKYFYQNLQIFSNTEEGRDQAILIISDALINLTFTSDPEILLSATIIRLIKLNE